jgi:puromycin-sensitive aminopeptidase
MSTYYLAFTAGELEFGGIGQGQRQGAGLLDSIPGKSHQLKFAQQIAAFASAPTKTTSTIGYYGGDKIDFIAMPDFAAGAMENLGCIIYRDDRPALRRGHGHPG